MIRVSAGRFGVHSPVVGQEIAVHLDRFSDTIWPHGPATVGTERRTLGGFGLLGFDRPIERRPRDAEGLADIFDGMGAFIIERAGHPQLALRIEFPRPTPNSPPRPCCCESCPGALTD